MNIGVYMINLKERKKENNLSTSSVVVYSKNKQVHIIIYYPYTHYNML